MFNTLRILLLSLSLLIMPGLVSFSFSAEPAKGQEEKVVRLQKKYQQLQSLEFDFSQSTQTSGRIKQGSGNAVFYRPAVLAGNGIMRWNYLEPTVQTIINDGKELSLYTPQDKQLIVSPARDMESDITYAIFTGTKKLQDEFEVTPPDKFFFLNDPPAGTEAVLLTPRQPHPQLKRIQLWLSGDLTIHRLLMEDHFGALTELTFTRVRFNTLPASDPKLLQSLLQLDLAPGTETIRQ